MQIHIPSELFWVIAFWLFSAVVQALPEPLPGERWYGAFYKLIHGLGANLPQSGLGRFLPSVKRDSSKQDNEPPKQ